MLHSTDYPKHRGQAAVVLAADVGGREHRRRAIYVPTSAVGSPIVVLTAAVGSEHRWKAIAAPMPAVGFADH